MSLGPQGNNEFKFFAYKFDEASKTLELTYDFNDHPSFTEKYKFDFDFVEYDKKVLYRAFDVLFLVAGVSYYKAFYNTHLGRPALIDTQNIEIDERLANFLNKTYQKGLGEYFYINNFDPQSEIAFPVTVDQPLQPLSISDSEGLLVGLGGGKDSLVSVELLRDQPKVATWSLNHREQLEPLVQATGLPHLWVEREWDQQLLTLNEQGAPNGHIPISAIFACVGVIVAILAGYKYAVVSNESSASDPTLEYQGVPINHQYSKSLEFERDFQSLLQHLFGESLGYFSLLRPFTELRIAELFAQIGFEKYQGVFSSCNRAFRNGEHHLFWCGECPKCAFVFLVLTPFVPREKLEQLWGGKNLLLDPSLEATYRQLLGIEGDKPLDCVGEVKESRAAMRLAQSKYPELDKYNFELPDDYDFRAWSPDSLTDEVRTLMHQKLD